MPTTYINNWPILTNDWIHNWPTLTTDSCKWGQINELLQPTYKYSMFKDAKSARCLLDDTLWQWNRNAYNNYGALENICSNEPLNHPFPEFFFEDQIETDFCKEEITFLLSPLDFYNEPTEDDFYDKLVQG